MYHWRCRAMRSLERSTNSGTSRGCGEFSADGLSFQRTGHLWCQRCNSSLAVVPLQSWNRTLWLSQTTEPQNMAFHCEHHPATTPLGVPCSDCQTGRPSRPLVATVSCQPSALTSLFDPFGFRKRTLGYDMGPALCPYVDKEKCVCVCVCMSCMSLRNEQFTVHVYIFQLSYNKTATKREQIFWVGVAAPWVF